MTYILYIISLSCRRRRTRIIYKTRLPVSNAVMRTILPMASQRGPKQCLEYFHSVTQLQRVKFLPRSPFVIVWLKQYVILKTRLFIQSLFSILILFLFDDLTVCRLSKHFLFLLMHDLLVTFENSPLDKYQCLAICPLILSPSPTFCIAVWHID
jgi:hypothetical protein